MATINSIIMVIISFTFLILFFQEVVCLSLFLKLV